MKPAKIVLIGPMGAGKTTLGKLVSAQLGWSYFDNDEELSEVNQMSAEHLAKLSVTDLHRLEQEYLASLLERSAPFISGAAASVVDYEGSRKLLRSAVAIYLRLPLEKLLERAGGAGIGRQALQENPQLVITERFIRRDPLYKDVAKFTLELGTDPNRDAHAILSFLEWFNV
jgi:shikimate kinase